MQKKWTGERLETFVINEAMIEHLHRYAIAMDYVKVSCSGYRLWGKGTAQTCYLKMPGK